MAAILPVAAEAPDTSADPAAAKWRGRLKHIRAYLNLTFEDWVKRDGSGLDEQVNFGVYATWRLMGMLSTTELEWCKVQEAHASLPAPEWPHSSPSLKALRAQESPALRCLSAAVRFLSWTHRHCPGAVKIPSIA